MLPRNAVVTARRSDDPRNTANNAGESQFLLRAADMMMPPYTDRTVAKTDGLRTSATPTAQVPASAGPTGWSHPRYAQAPTAYRPYPGLSLLRLFELIPTAPPGALSFAAIASVQRTGLLLHFSSHSLHRRTCPRSHHFRLVVPPSRLPAGSKTDASSEALVSPEHHALALTGSRLGELAPTLTTEFQDNAVRRFAWRPDDGRLDLHPAAALPAQP